MSKILLVDDDPFVHKVLEETLRESEWTGDIHSFDRGDSALRALKNGSSDMDMAIIDVNMPGLPGLDLVSSIRANANICRIPIIIYTGENWKETHLDAYQRGCSAILIKPHRMEDLKRQAKFLVDFMDLTAR